MRAERTRKFRRSCIDQAPENGCHDLGGGQGGTTQTVQKSDPWEGVQPYLKDLFSQAQGASARGPYGGPYIAPMSGETNLAIAKATSDATSPGSPVGQATDALKGYFNPNFLSIDGNPAIQSAMDAARRNVNSQFKGDNYGGSANKEWLARGTASAVAPMLLDQQSKQLSAAALAPTLQNAPLQEIAGAGAARDQYNQAAVQAGKEQYNAPNDALQRYMQLISGQGGGTTQSTNPYFSNPLASALGMGIGGLSLYNGLSSARLLGAGSSLGTAGGLTGAAELMAFA